MASSRRWAVLVALVALGFPLAVKLSWWGLDRSPTAWDDSAHVDQSLQLYDALRERGVPGLYRTFMHMGAANGPLFPLQALSFFALFGRSVASAQLVNAASLIVLSLYLLLLCRRFWPTPVGVMAVFLVGTSPLMYGLCTWYLREYSLATLVTMVAYHLVRSEDLRRRGQRLLVGVLLGLGLLHRQVFAFYVLPMYVAVVWTRLREQGGHGQGRWRIVADAATPWLVACPLVAPWYWYNGRAAFTHAWSSWAGVISNYFGSRNVLSLAEIGGYLHELGTEVFSVWYLGLLGLAALGCLWGWRRSRLRLHEIVPPGIRLLLLAWWAPFLVLLFSVNKDPRFEAPTIVPLAIVLAALLWGAARSLRSGVVWVVALLVPNTVLCAAVLFGWPIADASLPPWLGHAAYAHRYSRTAWPHVELLRRALALVPRDRRPVIVVVSDTLQLNANLLAMVARLEKLDCEIAHSAWATPAYLRTLFDRADIVLRKDGDVSENADVPNPGPSLFEAEFAGPVFSESPDPLALPDGSYARIWLRRGDGGIR
jgi:hypothetical protein